MNHGYVSYDKIRWVCGKCMLDIDINDEHTVYNADLKPRTNYVYWHRYCLSPGLYIKKILDKLNTEGGE